MPLEIKLDDKVYNVELLSEDDNCVKIMVDNKKYDLDIQQVENGVYSVLYKNQSFNIELIEKASPKKYSINTLYRSYEAEIIDAEAKYMRVRNMDNLDVAESIISSPMPGKVVKIPVSLKQKVNKGDTVIIVSAMKMESEYRAVKSGIIKEIFVREGDTVDGNQPLIHID